MQHVVVMGASNVSIGFPNIIKHVQTGFEGPVHLCGVEGHGRSYGIWSNIGPRALPAIRDSQLWNELDGFEHAGTIPKAFITDIGNDLMYEIAPRQIGEWVRECIQRLLDQRFEILMTMLPMGSVEKMTARRYYLFRTAMFTGNRFSFARINELVIEMDSRLREIVDEFSVTKIEPPGDWYGFDPIHIHRGVRSVAWNEYFSHWSGWKSDSNNQSAVKHPFSARQCLKLRPHDRRWFGKTQTFEQPAFKSEQLSISLF